MGRVTVSGACEKTHTGVAGRAAALLESQPGGADIVLCAKGEAPPPALRAARWRSGSGTRANTGALERLGPNRFDA